MYFICEKCGAIDDSKRENNFINVLYNFENYSEEYYNKHFCCTECSPRKYKDGVWTLSGSWHNYFKKKYYYELDYDVFKNLVENGQIYNGKKYLKKIKYNK